MRIAFVAASAAALALVGCNQTPPPRRDGLWLQSFSMDGSPRNAGPMRSVRVCVDAKSESGNAIFNHDLAVELAKKRNCQPPTASRSLEGIYKFSSNCPLPNGSGMSLLTGTASGDFANDFHLRMETVTTYSPPFTPMNSRHVTDIDGKWLGPCPPGMAPGDMILANGLKAPGGRIVDPHQHMPGRLSAPGRPSGPPSGTASPSPK
jgi:hypothetical protein